MVAVVGEGRRLLGNTVLNLLSQLIPLAVGIVSLPYTVHGLGAERFGMLSFAWVVVGYFGLFDLGLGRATTKFVSEAMSRGEQDRIPKIVWSSLVTQAVLGVTGGALLAIATPFVAGRVLKIQASAVAEMRDVLFLLSASIPVIVGSRNLRGVLEAAQRFDLINIVRIPLGALTFLIPMVGALLHLSVSAIVLWLVLLIVASMCAYLFYCFRVFPALATRPSVEGTMIPALLVFGGWVTISNVLIPTLVYLDRLLIGALVSVEALTYYTMPHEVASRLLIFPIALSTTLFPTFSALSAINWEDLKGLYVRSLKYIVIGLGPVAFLGAVFASDILRLWLGGDFAAKSTLVFQILSVGILLNALSLMPSNLFDGIGRPDVRAKIFLSYVFAYAGLLWLLISKMGIVGAAIAWTIRGGVECLLFFFVSARLLRLERAMLITNGLLRAIGAYCGLVSVTLTSFLLTHERVIQQAATLVWLAVFSVIVWKYVLDDSERGTLALSRQVH